MTFIIVLISLIIERFFHWSHLRHWRWLTVYQRALSHSYVSRMPSFIVFPLCILPAAALVELISYFLSGWVHGILKVVFGIIVLLYCLGPTNLWVQVYRCINQLNKEDDKAAMESVRTEFGIAPSEDPTNFYQTFTRAIFVASYERVFAVVFWFVVLGPAGAILYRSIALMSVDSPLGLTSMAKRTQQWLDWIPVRILTFIFILGGNFTRAFTCFRQTILRKPEANQLILADCGIAALDVTEGSELPGRAIVLLDRVFAISLVILAIGVLIV